MPTSTGACKPEFIEYFKAMYKPGMKVIDIGAGNGTYKDLLQVPMDAVEVWVPYVEEYNLYDKYDKVIISTAQSVDYTGYDIAILGDVLEHIDTKSAQELIQKLCQQVKHVFVIVPYMWEQGISHNNPFEEHQQPDLNDEVMAERYPQLEKIIHGPKIARTITVWRNKQ